MNRKQTPANLLRKIPTKWAVAIVLALVAYAIAQPAANKRLGWQLPSLAGILGQDDARPAEMNQSRERSDDDQNLRETSVRSEGSEVPERTEVPERVDGATGELRYGLLTKVGRYDYLSPAGLKYTRGSAEGHRLKHIERHLKDQPDRSGNHGVFYGDMAQVIRWIDDVYQRGKSGSKDTKKRKEDRRTVYEAPFDKPIGFVGGRSGARKGNPDANRLRLVVEGNLVITAFPF